MATINSNTQLALINASNPGTINLPSASLGQLLTFKDALGSFGTNNITLVCATFDTFEDGASSKLLKEVRGNIQIVGSGTKWYVLSGTQVNTLNVSSITSIGVSSFSISTSALYLSSLSLIDNNKSTNTLYTSSFLNYNNYIIAGTRIGYNGFVTPLYTTFNLINYPKTISGLALWLDGADSTTITSSSGNVSQWNDKSGNARNAITRVGTITYNASQINNMPTITFSAASYLSNTMTYTSTSRNVFAVVTIGGYGPSAAVTYTIITTSSGSIGIQVYSYTTAGSLTGDIEMNYSGKVLLAAIYGVGGYYNTTSILATTNSTGNSGIFVNGSPTTLQVDSTGSATYTTGSVTQYIGGYNGTQPTIIGELIVYDASMTTVQRQQVEGYLALKWGLQSSLPANHPYKYNPPV